MPRNAPGTQDRRWPSIRRGYYAGEALSPSGVAWPQQDAIVDPYCPFLTSDTARPVARSSEAALPAKDKDSAVCCYFHFNIR